MSFFSADSKKEVVLHMGGAVLVFFSLILSFYYIYLPWTTNHGQVIKVPNLEGKTLSEIELILQKKDLRYHISDSFYQLGRTPLSVISQYPKEGSEVKEGRKIYITIASHLPSQIKMPNLKDASLLNARMVLESCGLKVGNIKKVPHFAEGAVLGQSIGSRPIKTGDMVSKGTSIDLVVGDGISSISIAIPNLVGMDMNDALSQMEDTGLKIGGTIFDENSDEPKGKIIRQKPAFSESDSIKQGQAIDIWVAGKNPGHVILEDNE